MKILKGTLIGMEGQKLMIFTQVISHGGGRYILTFIDDHSRKV